MSHAIAANRTPHLAALMRHWLLVLLAMMCFIIAAEPVLAKRTNGGLVGGIVPTPAVPPTPVPAQFDMTGYIQDATLATVGDPMCPAVTDQRVMGGTVTINGIKIIVPCNTVLQMPAFALTWADLWTMAPKDIMPAGSLASGLSLDDVMLTGALGLLSTPSLSTPTGNNAALPAHELHVQGNIINGQYIAGLIFISQQSLNGGQGVITCIDYPTGELQINGPALPGTYSTDGKCAAPTITTTRVRMNDPIGRFGWDHGGPTSTASVKEAGYDPRYTADTDNPTMHSALGFPICIPAFGPPGSANSDPLCPIYNRPVADANGVCPSFPTATTLPGFTANVPGDWCRTWVMDLPGAHALNPAKSDPTLSAPLVIGDTVNFSGTLKADATGVYVSAHTIAANLGIYTQPHSKPSYVTVEEVLVGTGGAAVAGLAVEATNKVSWVGFASDPTELVDMFAVHQDPITGATTEFYLGTQDPCCTPLGRFRTPANNLGAFGEPQRNYRAISRNACQPDTTIANVDPNTGLLMDPANPGVLLTQLQTVCHMDPLSFVPAAGASSGATVRVPNTTTGQDNILSVGGLLLNQNGLVPGQFTLPNFDFIFAENLNFGAPLVPNNFQDLPFLFCGSGPLNPGAPVGPGNPVVGQLSPAPWASPMPDPVFHSSLCPSALAVGAAPTTTTTTATPLPPVIVSATFTTTTGVVVGKPAIVNLSVNATNPNGTAAMTYQFTPLPGITITPLSAITTGTWTATATFTPTAAGTINFAGLVSNGVGTGTGFTIPVTVVAATTAKAPTINSFNSALAGTNTGSFVTGQTVQMIAVATPSTTNGTLTFKFTQTAGQTPAVTLSAVQPAPAGYCRLPQICQMVTFTAPLVPAKASLTFNVTVTETQTSLSASKASGTVGISPPPPDTIAITAAAWIAERTISGTPTNIGKFNVTATSSAGLGPVGVGMTMTAFLSNSTIPAGQPGSATNPIPMQLTGQAADLPGTATPVCGATPCWTGNILGVIDNHLGDNIAPFTITVRSNLGGVSTMLIGDPLYTVKCTAGTLTATFNPATGICTVQ